MKRSNLVKFSVLLVVALVFLSCVSSVNAKGHKEKVKYRPLRHYTKNNPSVFYWWYGPSPTYEYRLDLANYLPLGEGTPPPKGTYDGYIEERELPDGRAEITVYLTLHDAPFWLWNWMEGNLVLEGMIDFYFEIEKFIIERPGAEIPFILDILYPDNWLVIFGSGSGHGIFTEFADGFTQGAEGMFSLFQYCYVEDGIDYWPYEILNVHEL
jgi:hypothetical protein